MSNQRKLVFNDTKSRTRNITPGTSFEVYFELEYKPKLIDGEKKYNTIVEVINEDTLVALDSMISENLKPLVLNMASDIVPGGGVSKGAMAQEEELFRRTNYCWSITSKPYPLVDKAILTTGVSIIKDAKYKLLDNIYTADFIACASIRRPTLSDNGTYSDTDRDEMRKRIFNIFEIGVLNTNDSLLLSAFGCGAFRNPPEEVAMLFKEAIVHYDGYFKVIRFAIYDTKNEGNYEIFRDIIQNKIF